MDWRQADSSIDREEEEYEESDVEGEEEEESGSEVEAEGEPEADAAKKEDTAPGMHTRTPLGIGQC